MKYPVYDATGLSGFYNIDFSKDNLAPLESIREGLAKIGLGLTEDQKEMDVLLISGRP